MKYFKQALTGEVKTELEWLEEIGCKAVFDDEVIEGDLFEVEEWINGEWVAV